MNNNVSMQNNSSANNGPRFCIKCGTAFGDANYCPQCGTPRIANANSSSNDQQVSLITQCVKGVFSDKPLNSIENACKLTGSGLWGIVGMVGCVLVGLGAGNTFVKLINEIIVFGAWLISFDSSEPTTGLFAAIIISIIAQFFASAGIAKIVFSKSNNSPTYVQVLNMNAIAIVPMAIAAIVSFFVAFISGILSAGILVVGLCISMIVSYFGYQKAAKFSTSPLWRFAAALSLDSVSFIAIAWVLIKILYH